MNAAARREASNELLLLLLAAGAVMLFATFGSAYFIRRTSPDWIRVPVPVQAWIGVAAVVAGSLAAEMARRTRDRLWFGAAFGAALLFAAGQAATWRALASAGVADPSNPQASFFLMLAVVHALHLAAGLAALGAAWAGRLGAGIAAAWWHFVGALWLYVLLLVGFA